MKNLTEHLSQYAAYHRDRRNIATHFVGIPMIVLAVVTLLGRPIFAEVAGLPITPATLVFVGAMAFYLRLDLGLGLTMLVTMTAATWGGHQLAQHSTEVWLGGGVGLFVVGWIIQFLGHWFEGKKPAFVDDLIGLLVGPLFVVTVVVFAVGLRAPLREEIERRVGPTLIREARPAPSA